MVRRASRPTTIARASEALMPLNRGMWERRSCSSAGYAERTLMSSHDAILFETIKPNVQLNKGPMNNIIKVTHTLLNLEIDA